MPKVSLLKVSLNRKFALGIGLPCSGEIVVEMEPAISRPGWSKGLGYLMLTVPPIAPEDRVASGDFITSTWLTKSAPTELKSKMRPLAVALEILRPSNNVSTNCGPRPRMVMEDAVPWEVETQT